MGAAASAAISSFFKYGIHSFFVPTFDIERKRGGFCVTFFVG